MAIPIVLYVVSASQALPIIAVRVARGRHPPAPLTRLSLLCALFVVADVVDLVSAVVFGHNRYTHWVLLPAEVGVTFWLLASWQPGHVLRTLYLASIPAMLVASAVLMIVFDPKTMFELWIGPLLALACLGGAVHTLVHRSLWSRDQLIREDWFWILLGMSLLWLGFVPVPPFVEVYLSTELRWAAAALLSRAWLVLVAFVLITWGVLCPRTPPRSPGLSLQPAPRSS